MLCDRYKPHYILSLLSLIHSFFCKNAGNFYSLHGDHEKACAYFKRAVRLDKTNHTSWILLGHEYLEMKNHTLAIDAYTKAYGMLNTIFQLEADSSRNSYI